VLAQDDAPVVGLAAEGLADDLEAVTGQDAEPPPGRRRPTGRPQVWIGTLGRNPAIDRLVAARKLDVGQA
jgi:hypothetical protein